MFVYELNCCEYESRCSHLIKDHSFNSFMTKVPIILKPVLGLLCKSMGWFLYDKDLYHERVKEFLSLKLRIAFFFFDPKYIYSLCFRILLMVAEWSFLRNGCNNNSNSNNNIVTITQCFIK